jgi:hypothetical protein
MVIVVVPVLERLIWHQEVLVPKVVMEEQVTMLGVGVVVEEVELVVKTA